MSGRILVALFCLSSLLPAQQADPKTNRLVILKIDGLGADLLYGLMAQHDPATNRSKLPWFNRVFAENGVIFDNFYTRGISLSAPSWSMLNSGYHTVIRGNVEYDRYTGHVYDYTNIVLFYLGYARLNTVDMPGVDALHEAGIPLTIDSFPYQSRSQGFQLFQEGVSWVALRHVLERHFSKKTILSMVEDAGVPPITDSLAAQTEADLLAALKSNTVLYLDGFTGDVDHEGHATSSRAALYHLLQQIDQLVGRIYVAIEQSPWAGKTLFAVVSDHGMNNVEGVISQGFSLSDFFNSPDGGAHHVVTNRYVLSDFKLVGLNPFVKRVPNASTASFYLKGEAARYPTAWLDIDGNERASVQLRNSDLNRLHILLQQLSREDLSAPVRQAAQRCFLDTVERHRESWKMDIRQITAELAALEVAINQRAREVKEYHKKPTAEERQSGLDKVQRRKINELAQWRQESKEYTGYVAHLKALLSFEPSKTERFKGAIADLVPPLTLGDRNSLYDLQNYVAGPSSDGIVLDPSGKLDEGRSFRHVNYFPRLIEQTARNNPQSALPPHPIDFATLALPPDAVRAREREVREAYWLYGGVDRQLLILIGRSGRYSLRPIRNLTADERGGLHWQSERWLSNFPLRLWEDPALRLPSGEDRGRWLSEWHSEEEWMQAIHRCRYSNGVIGIREELSPIAANVRSAGGSHDELLLRLARRRRELVQADFHVFAADHWNFNLRNFNPGGNHGGFFRISTHSVWMMSGAGTPQGKRIEEPYDSLNFASTVMKLVGLTPPMPEKAVKP